MTSHLRSLFVLFFILTGSLKTIAVDFKWPFSTDEFQKKLSSRDLDQSVRFYARGPSFLNGQIWNETEFLEQLQKQNYRIREAEQNLMASDAKKLSMTQCQIFLSLQNTDNISHCWTWKTQLQIDFTVLISKNSLVLGTYQGSPPKPYWKASLDPLLVAQYREKKPVLQMDFTVSEIPVNCLNAIMAIEDSDFLEHSGLSYMGLARSLYKNILKGRYAQGGSTITQQLVKNYFLTPEKTIERKLKEMYLAIKLESEWNKNQILETYLNVIYMGQWGALQVIGFGAGANYYFNKPLPKLNLAECSLLAAIVNNPARYNPWQHKETSLARRQQVLTKMKDLKLISEIEFQQASSVELPKETISKSSETAPYFFEAVQRQLSELNLSSDSKNVYTSLELSSQEAAQNALKIQISEFEKSKKAVLKNKEKGLNLEGLVIASENQTGLVTALVGGQSYKKTQFNRALQGHRQIGSLIKPFVFLSALTDNSLTPVSIIEDQKFEWKYDKKIWMPDNYENKYHGEVPLYFALKESLNSPTAQLAKKVGISNIISLVQKIGFTSKMDDSPATSLGASQHYATEVIEAYRTLANLGNHSKSGFIESVTDHNENVLFEYQPKFDQVLNLEESSVLVGMMKETLLSGTAKSSGNLGWKKVAAGKTGTTSQNRDAWFAGFTPQQTAVVWLGYDQSASHQLTGGSGCLPIWVNFMKSYSSKWPDADFNFSANTERKEVTLFGSPNKKTELIFKK